MLFLLTFYCNSHCNICSWKYFWHLAHTSGVPPSTWLLCHLPARWWLIRQTAVVRRRPALTPPTRASRSPTSPRSSSFTPLWVPSQAELLDSVLDTSRKEPTATLTGTEVSHLRFVVCFDSLDCWVLLWCTLSVNHAHRQARCSLHNLAHTVEPESGWWYTATPETNRCLSWH